MGEIKRTGRRGKRVEHGTEKKGEGEGQGIFVEKTEIV